MEREKPAVRLTAEGRPDLRQASPEGVAYALAHITERPLTQVARRAGLSLSTVYRLARQAGAPLDGGRDRKREGVERLIARLYPHMTASEVARETGMAKSTVNRWARRLGVAHSPETLERIAREQAARRAKSWTAETARKRAEAARRAKSWTAETARKRAEATRRRRRMDELRILSGQPQETRFRFKRMPRRCYKAIWHYVNHRGYFQVDGEPYSLYYDGQTRRTPLEDRAAAKHGLRFLPADGEDGEEPPGD